MLTARLSLGLAQAPPERSNAAFDDERLAIGGDVLVMRRYDTVIRFERSEP
jgi:hypothetical protein